MSNKINILSTKKLSNNQKQVLLNANSNVFEEDFIETKIKNFEPTILNENLIFTSQNAVQSILQHTKCNELKNKNVFCVGIKTKDLLTENGFNVEVYVDYASDLAEIISLIYNQESFTFFSGNLRRAILPNSLKENAVKFNEIEVYETKLTSKKITEKLDGVLFFSPSAIESYLKLNTLKNEICFCIGETTAEALEHLEYENYIIAENPTIDAVIEEVINHFS